MSETWKDIAEYNGEYQVSSLGKVKSVKNNLVLKHWLSTRGYGVVHLWTGGEVKKCLVHRLVANVFIPNPESKPYIDHINTVKTDNRVENLRWVTSKENSNNKLTIEKLRRASLGDRNAKTMTGKFGRLSPVSIPVVRLSFNFDFVDEFECAREAMRKTGIDCCSITNCCRGKRKSAGGFIWMYKHDYE
jgi:hypothetical protein